MFDAFELMKVAEYNDSEGGTYREPIVTEDDQAFADDEAVDQFFTIYGHYQQPPDSEAADGAPAGMEALFDFPLNEYHRAVEMYDWLCSILEDARKYRCMESGV
jgi:hypothetical protein